jgi:hypothetical protein
MNAVALLLKLGTLWKESCEDYKDFLPKGKNTESTTDAK